ncbi:hypothetical protein [Lachnoclostridium sp. Marseille-P6806]|uniref:hypothetical protein n=1 Tax=Lachnoclostridium sp. Marseille-P6806 TaxID=2364793 RepID=UPI001031AD56|nr:hypothetical protein [Lachnoclostridium sp. Marseille-P6806]
MGNISQRFIYNLSAAAPLCFIFALVWYWQKKTRDISCIAICIGIVLVILFIVSFAYGKRHFAPIKIRINDIAPYDSWVIVYIITYMFPFASLAIKDINLIICVIIAGMLIMAAPCVNTAIPNPILFLRGYHFYQVSGEHGISGSVLISNRKLRKAKDVKTVNRIFDYLLLDAERR